MNDAQQAAIDAVDAEDVVELARQALRIRSPSGDEAAAARFFVDRMRAAGLMPSCKPCRPRPIWARAATRSAG